MRRVVFLTRGVQLQQQTPVHFSDFEEVQKKKGVWQGVANVKQQKMSTHFCYIPWLVVAVAHIMAVLYNEKYWYF